VRRTYISPEFRYDRLPGTMNMRESTSFFGSKMMDVEDRLVIADSNIVYYQNSAGEQVSLSLERNNPAVVYNTLEDKRSNHTIAADPSQPRAQAESNTRWLVTVDIGRILSNYLFATLKQSRTFEGVRNQATIYNSVSDAMREYVAANLVGRYELRRFDFWVSYVPLSTQGALRFQNRFATSALSGTVVTKTQTSYNFDKSSVRVAFNQELPSTTHAFDYYFSTEYERL